MGQLKASIIIPTFNRRIILQKALVALARSSISFDQFEVVVVDDGSTDDTKEMITALDVPYKLTYETQDRKGLRECP